MAYGSAKEKGTSDAAWWQLEPKQAYGRVTNLRNKIIGSVNMLREKNAFFFSASRLTLGTRVKHLTENYTLRKIINDLQFI